MLIQVPEVSEQRLAFVPAGGVKKALAAPAAPPESTLSLGGPAIITLTADIVKDDPELVEYIKQTETTYRFFLIYIACTFLPQDGETFEKAWVQIRLARGDGQADPKPLAWSMKPDKLSADVEVTATAKFGSKLKLLDAGVDLAQKRTYKLVYLQPLNELQSNPTWYLKSVDGVDIDGCYRFQLVVQAPLGGSVAELDLTAELRRKRWGLIPYKAAFPDSPHKSFTLG